MERKGKNNQIGEKPGNSKLNFNLEVEPLEDILEKTPNGEKSKNDLFHLNWALVFRCNVETFGQIRDYLQSSGAKLFYQCHSTERLVIKVEPFQKTLLETTVDHSQNDIV